MEDSEPELSSLGERIRFARRKVGISSDATKCPHCGRMLTPGDIDRQKARLAGQTRWVTRVLPWLILAAIAVGLVAGDLVFRALYSSPAP